MSEGRGPVPTGTGPRLVLTGGLACSVGLPWALRPPAAYFHLKEPFAVVTGPFSSVFTSTITS